MGSTGWHLRAEWRWTKAGPALTFGPESEISQSLRATPDQRDHPPQQRPIHPPPAAPRHDIPSEIPRAAEWCGVAGAHHPHCDHTDDHGPTGDLLEKVGTKGIYLEFNETTVTRPVLEAFRTAGFRVGIWSGRAEHENWDVIRFLSQSGAEVINTDEPRKLVESL